MTYLWNILHSLVDSLPDLANIGLAVGGVLLSFPLVAQRIEENPRKRLSVAAGCFVLGVAAFFASRQQRREFSSDMRDIIKNTNAW
jgi:hypothetical protein